MNSPVRKLAELAEENIKDLINLQDGHKELASAPTDSSPPNTSSFV
ncbi:MAG: hypothetical protein ACJAWK_001691 [Candidatus Azotimanducaceae bacterium]|jgi:hypothetical protein